MLTRAARPRIRSRRPQLFVRLGKSHRSVTIFRRCPPSSVSGFTGPSVTEFRGQLLRPFRDGRLLLSTQVLIAHGYTGETTEVFAYPTDPTFPTPIERVVGVPLKSYITATITYRFFR